MVKLNSSIELNPFDHLYIFEHIENVQANNLLKRINNKTVEFVTGHNCYFILHKSTKKNNTVQLSRFNKNNEAYSDSEYNSYAEAIKQNALWQYKIKEVM